MNHAINRFNKITVLGKERAERTIFSVLGNLIRNDWKGKVNDIYYDRSSELKGLASYDRALEEEEFEQEAFENVDPEDLFAGSGFYSTKRPDDLSSQSLNNYVYVNIKISFFYFFLIFFIAFIFQRFILKSEVENERKHFKTIKKID